MLNSKYCGTDNTYVTHLALVDEAKNQSSHFSREDRHDDQKELERNKRGKGVKKKRRYWKLSEMIKLKLKAKIIWTPE